MALFGLIGTKQADGKRRLSSKTTSALKIAHLPGIFPRIRALGGKFGHFAYLLALIYRSARLLPAGHPMLNPANIGRYGVRDVIATAANSLVMKRENIDQIFIFGAVLAAMAMIVIQGVLIAFYAFFSSANAASASGTNYFTTPKPDTDLLFTFLRNVFGVKGIFGNDDNNAMVVQAGLHAILGFYSTAMMIVAVIIVIYYVITVVGESAQTGTPFGKRFNGLWAPVRLILALGLLVPLGGGLNTAQYLTLMVAKFGSSLATNAWGTYTKTFTFRGANCQDINENSGPTDPNKPSCGGLSMATTPSVASLGNFIFGAEACRAVYNKINPTKPVNIYAEFNGSSSAPSTIDPGDVSAIQGQGSLRYVWTTETHRGKISDATCGSISMEINNPTASTNAADTLVNNLKKSYQAAYISAMQSMVNAISGGASGAPSETSPAGMFAKKYIITNGAAASVRNDIKISDMATPIGTAIDAAQTKINAVSFSGDYSDAVVENMRKEAYERGWGSAGSYYLEMAKVTQVLLDATRSSFPYPTEQSIGANNGINDTSWFSPSAWLRWWNNDSSSNAAEKEIRTAMAHLGEVVAQVSPQVDIKRVNSNNNSPQFSAQFGITRPILYISQFLFSEALVRLLDQPTLNPMARLIQAGSDILDKSEVMLYAFMGAKASENSSWASAGVKSAAAGLGGWYMTGSAKSGATVAGLALIGSMAPSILMFMLLLGLVAGIMLYYILPLLPFMYFFFSTVNWVIEVAESFIAAPLFALSHLRIDGDGLPGQNAYSGWLTLFGVMLRPILIILGLIMATLIFGAASYYLAFIYKQAIFSYRAGNAAELDLASVGQFGIIMYVLIFVYITYMLANSTFKLIDTIPDKAMRWIGGQQPFTGDKPVDVGSMQTLAVAGYAGISQAQGALEGALKSREERKARKEPPSPPAGSAGGGP